MLWGLGSIVLCTLGLGFLGLRVWSLWVQGFRFQASGLGKGRHTQGNTLASVGLCV